MRYPVDPNHPTMVRDSGRLSSFGFLVVACLILCFPRLGSAGKTEYGSIDPVRNCFKIEPPLAEPDKQTPTDAQIPCGSAGPYHRVFRLNLCRHQCCEFTVAALSPCVTDPFDRESALINVPHLSLGLGDSLQIFKGTQMVKYLTCDDCLKTDKIKEITPSLGSFSELSYGQLWSSFGDNQTITFRFRRGIPAYKDGGEVDPGGFAFTVTVSEVRLSVLASRSDIRWPPCGAMQCRRGKDGHVCPAQSIDDSGFKSVPWDHYGQGLTAPKLAECSNQDLPKGRTGNTTVPSLLPVSRLTAAPTVIVGPAIIFSTAITITPATTVTSAITIIPAITVTPAITVKPSTTSASTVTVHLGGTGMSKAAESISLQSARHRTKSTTVHWRPPAPRPTSAYRFDPMILVRPDTAAVTSGGTRLPETAAKSGIACGIVMAAGLFIEGAICRIA